MFGLQATRSSSFRGALVRWSTVSGNVTIRRNGISSFHTGNPHQVGSRTAARLWTDRKRPDRAELPANPTGHFIVYVRVAVTAVVCDCPQQCLRPGLALHADRRGDRSWTRLATLPIMRAVLRMPSPPSTAGRAPVAAHRPDHRLAGVYRSRAAGRSAPRSLISALIPLDRRWAPTAVGRLLSARHRSIEGSLVASRPGRGGCGCPQ